MDGNKFRYCTFLLIDDDNHSKIFISKKNKYYIKHEDNRLLRVKVKNSFEGIRESYEIDVHDITDNSPNTDKPSIIKYCTILLIDDIHTGRIYISEKICTILVMLVILPILMMMIMMTMMIVIN